MTDEQNPMISPPLENPSPGTPSSGVSSSETLPVETLPLEPSPLETLPPESHSSESPSSELSPSEPSPSESPSHADVQTSLPSDGEPAAASAAATAASAASAQSPDSDAGSDASPSLQDSPSKADTPAAESSAAETGTQKTDESGNESGKEEPRQRPPSGLFKKYITENKIFKNREVLRHSYSPRELPHRDEQIDSIAEILAPALQGATPSNILIYGKTGTGKTATVKYVGGELENESSGFTPCRLIHLNCETIDTQYRVLAQIANCVSEIDNKASDRIKNTIPPTGWHTDQVYSELKNILEHAGGLQIIVLDEIDKLVKKSGDDTLYSLTRINSDLTKSRVCIIGISNDLTFKDFLDPRVLSSLSEEELVFPPYNAAQLADILKQRAQTAFLEGAVSDDVISLCAARAAQEHGDARRALDLLRVSGELAEREGASHVEERHVAAAQESIETDTMSECVKTLPVQSKIVLSSMLLLAGSGQKVFTSGQVVGIYRDLVKELDADSLSHRRVSELINDLTMLGIVSSRVVSYGRHGRTTEIYFDKPTNEIRRVIMNEPRFMECSILSSLIR